MNYENYPCPGCGAHLHEDDDVVVCPVCATPQHRSCWLENNRCVNADKHDEGYIWAPQSTVTPAAEIPAQPKSDITVCHICGSENPSDMTNCGHCGALLNNQTKTGVFTCSFCGGENEPGAKTCEHCGAPLIRGNARPIYPGRFQVNTDQYSDDDIIGECSAAEIASFVRQPAEKYMTEFRKIAGGERAKFNWAAFFFGPLWFFYRRIYKVGLAIAAVNAAISLIFAGAFTQITELLTPYVDQIQNQTISQDEMLKLSEKMFAIGRVPFCIGLLAMLVVSIICGLIANKVYFKKVTESIKVISEQVSDLRMRKAFIASQGGKSVFSAISGFFVYDLLASLFTYIAEFVADRF